MSEVKHDPLPWTYELTDSMEDDEDTFVIQSPDGDVAEVCSPAATAEGNAKLIVKAVNCHAELLAACDAAVAALTMPSLGLGDDALLKLATALAKATGA